MHTDPLLVLVRDEMSGPPLCLVVELLEQYYIYVIRSVIRMTTRTSFDTRSSGLVTVSSDFELVVSIAIR